MTEIAINYHWSILIGIFISQGLGFWLTPEFLKWIRKNYKTAAVLDYELPKGGALDWLTGVLERIFFTIIIAFNVSGAAVAMVSWLLVKMVTSWNSIIDPDRRMRGYALCSLAAGLVSLSFALIGGLFIRYEIQALYC